MQAALWLRLAPAAHLHTGGFMETESLFSPNYPGTLYVDQAGFELTEIFRPLLPELELKTCVENKCHYHTEESRIKGGRVGA